VACHGDFQHGKLKIPYRSTGTLLFIHAAFPAIFRGGCNPFIQQLVKKWMISSTTEYDVSLSTSAPLEIELKVGPRIRL